jgi:hypothetical protein
VSAHTGVPAHMLTKPLIIFLTSHAAFLGIALLLAG